MSGRRQATATATAIHSHRRGGSARRIAITTSSWLIAMPAANRKNSRLPRRAWVIASATVEAGRRRQANSRERGRVGKRSDYDSPSADRGRRTASLDTPRALPYADWVRLAASAYPEWLREQARRRHSNQAPFARKPRCYFLPDKPGEIRASADRPVSEVTLSSLCPGKWAPSRLVGI